VSTCFAGRRLLAGLVVVGALVLLMPSQRTRIEGWYWGRQYIQGVIESVLVVCVVLQHLRIVGVARVAVGSKVF